MEGPGHSWRITRQIVDQTTNDDAGNTVVGAYIYFVTGDGNTGVVFIPNNLLNHDHVKATVKAQAKTLDTIGRLHENMG